MNVVRPGEQAKEAEHRREGNHALTSPRRAGSTSSSDAPADSCSLASTHPLTGQTVGTTDTPGSRRSAPSKSQSCHCRRHRLQTEAPSRRKGGVTQKRPVDDRCSDSRRHPERTGSRAARVASEPRGMPGDALERSRPTAPRRDQNARSRKSPAREGGLSQRVRRLRTATGSVVTPRPDGHRWLVRSPIPPETPAKGCRASLVHLHPGSLRWRRKRRQRGDRAARACNAVAVRFGGCRTLS